MVVSAEGQCLPFEFAGVEVEEELYIVEVGSEHCMVVQQRIC